MKELKFITIDTPKQEQSPVCSCTDAESSLSIPGPGPKNESARSIKKQSRWILGEMSTPAGTVPRVSAEWTWADYRGQIKSRLSAFRMKYSVEPGLYAVGEPGRGADIFVSANYKLSFDILRRELNGLNAWIIVLDTKGINVWCAAGKGTLSTDELVERIRETGIGMLVDHRRIILPQLGAAGVNAAAVRKSTGFRVYFGPVYAKDIPSYLRAGHKKTEAMRRIDFTLQDRLILTPMELNPALNKFPLFALILLLLFGIQPEGIMFGDAWIGGMPFLLLGLISVFSGAFATPVLLPFIPSRSFAVKGWLTGLISVWVSLQLMELPSDSTILFSFTWIFFPAMSSYLALQFTGSTTFTGMSGVRKELKYAVPAYFAALGISLMLLLGYKLSGWGVI